MAGRYTWKMDIGVRLRLNSSVIITRETLWWNIGQFESGIRLLEHDKLLPHGGGGKIIIELPYIHSIIFTATWQLNFW